MKKKTIIVPNEHLKRERKLRFWSQQHVARQIGTTALTVSRWECGITSPGLHYCNELCKLFGKGPQELGLTSSAKRSDGKLEIPLSIEQSLPLSLRETQIYDPSVPLPYAATGRLVGRDHLSNQLKQKLRICSALSLNGLPGAGKSVLAVQLVHDREVQQHFCDGFLWAGLGCQPNTHGLLSRWGKLLGAAPEESGDMTNIQAWARSIHATIGTRRMLIVIDDAWTIEDALALKVGGANCVHLVTTRFPEIALKFAGNNVIIVRELSEKDSTDLLAQLAPAVVTSEPQEVQRLIQSVGGLPLALTLIGKYLQTQAHSGQPRRLRSAIERLHHAEERLRLTDPHSPVECIPSLSAGTSPSLQAVIHVSGQQLTPPAYEALCALSVFPAKPNTFSEDAALAVCNTSVEAIDILTDSGLLEGSGPGRYMMHQTIADYATLHRTNPLVEERIVNYFLTYIEAHSTDYDSVELELNNILVAIDLARKQGMSVALVRSINAIAPFLKARGLHTPAEQHLHSAREAALALNDMAGLATTLLNLGRLAELRGDFTQAEQSYHEGLEVARGIANHEIMSDLLAHRGEAALISGDYTRAEAYLREGLVLAQGLKHSQRCSILLKNLGEIAASHGDYMRGEMLYTEALGLAREAHDQETMSALLQNLGVEAHRCGDYTRATALYEEGLLLAREVGHSQRISALLMNIGLLMMRQRHYTQAKTLYLESLELARKISMPLRISAVLQNLGALEGERGNYKQAKLYLDESLEVAWGIGHRWLISETLYEKGELYLKLRQVNEAKIAFAQSLDIARTMGAQELIAFALYGLARVAVLQEKHVDARGLGEESLVILRAIGNEKVGWVTDWLREIGVRARS